MIARQESAGKSVGQLARRHPGEDWRRQERAHICYIVPGEEDLGDGLLQVAEQAVPYVHQAALADGGEGLELGDMFWPLVPLHAPHADADGAGRDNDDAVAIFP